LRGYLDDIGFSNLYRYIVSQAGFYLTPLAVNARGRDNVVATESYLTGSLVGMRLVWALMGVMSVTLPELTPGERDLAAALAESGYLVLQDGRIDNAGLQLICVGDAYVLIDAAITFPLGRSHDVYIGPDTLLLIHYLDKARLGAGSRVLDLCTGTGAIGLTAARVGATVVSTDIAPRPLALGALNRALNGRDARIELRDEAVAVTLARDDTWDVIACNPPFIASPSELNLPVYARGPGHDGLDMMRAMLA